MKLGDNMTMEAYNVWEGVAPRKCRPPRIGDIPKHGAVDEESPGSSTKQLTISPSDPRDSALNISLDCTGNIVFPLESASSAETFSCAQKFEPRKASFAYSEKEIFPQKSKSREQNLRESYPVNREFYPAKQDSYPVKHESYPVDPESSSVAQESYAEKLESYPVKQESRDSVDTEFYRRQQSFSPRSSRLSSPADLRDYTRNSLDPDDRITIKLSPTKVLPVDYQSENKPQESSRIPSSPEDISDQEIIEVRKDSALFLEEAEGLPSLRDILRTRAPRFVRPRRESSGYGSNLGTFDEDRRNSASVDVLQDLSSFLKERRRSSTKRLNSRIGIGKPEESRNTEEVANTGDRMPTTEIYRKVSSAGLEMPNIEEVKEVLRDEPSSRQESLDNLCNLDRDGTEQMSARCYHPKETPNLCTSANPLPCVRQEVPDTLKSSVTTNTTNLSRDVFDTTPLKESIQLVSSSIAPSSSPRTSSRMFYQHSMPAASSPNTESLVRKSTAEKLSFHADQTKEPWEVERSKIIIGPQEESVEERKGETRKDSEAFLTIPDKVFSSSVKVYQLLSTQSEDTADEPRLADRRISLQISKHENEILPIKLEHTSVEKISTSSGFGSTEGRSSGQTSGDGSPIRKLSSPSDGTTHRFLGDPAGVTVRPIYPYCPYSPYGSPQGSPRNRRRPLRESRRVSIDNRQGALQLNQYKLLDNIGQGSYGIVKLVYNEEDETHYAMKILSKKKLMKKAGIFGRMAPGRKGSANPLAKVYREIALLKKLDHPNVVKLVEVLDDPDEDNLYLVFELVQRGEVLEIPTDKPLDEETARKNFRDIVMGVEYLHYQRIVHRDIKPSNLLVDSDGRVKIADLGVSAELRASEELLSGPAGTPAFAAPETTTPSAQYSGTLCDVWSMGVTLYSLVTGRVPWDGAGSIIGVQTAVRTEPLKFPEKPSLSEELRHLISKMLAKDPAERIALSEIKEHAWLTERGTEPLPSEADNCRLPVTVTDEEVERVVTRVPKLDTLILIKTMLKQHSFQNPFLPKRSSRTPCADSVASSLEVSSSARISESLSRKETIRNMKSERFQKSGRSNSAPDSYDWQTNGRQISMESPLPPVTEASSQESEIEKR